MHYRCTHAHVCVLHNYIMKFDLDAFCNWLVCDARLRLLKVLSGRCLGMLVEWRLSIDI